VGVEKINIEKFLQLAENFPVLDVRSPAEYKQAHIPGALSVPLFTDEERKVVGTAYKQQSRQAAIKIGLDFFGPKMRTMVEEVEKIVGSWKLEVGSSGLDVGGSRLNVERSGFDSLTYDDSVNRLASETQNSVLNAATSNFQQPPSNPTTQPSNLKAPSSNPQLTTSNVQPPTSNPATPKAVLVHCWRGGMRSAGVAWLLDLYGFKVYTLIGGYKVFRNWVLKQFQVPYHFNILGGYTGSGKTEVLKALRQQQELVVDLESLAGHKGSAFGNIGLPPQPSQEMFENRLALNLHSEWSKAVAAQRRIWLEDESQRIGTVNIPQPLWVTMRSSPVYFLDIPFEQRLLHIVEEYGALDKEKIADATTRLQKRLGGLETKTALAHLRENDLQECFRILLKYYDRYYLKGLNNRDNRESLINTIPCTTVDAAANAHDILKTIQTTNTNAVVE
jgi:tRNA 2-selenouridine synthase